MRSPRKRGPILFWFTLALIALAEGVLGIVDLAGAAIADPAYPALAVGDHRRDAAGRRVLRPRRRADPGRPGLGRRPGRAPPSPGSSRPTTVHETPTSAVAVADGYQISSGELIVDLTNVTDLQALDGRTIRVTADVGRIEVIVPDGLDTDVTADVDGPGDIRLFGEETGGIDIDMNRSHDGGTDVPRITIDADLSVGQIEVHQ